MLEISNEEIQEYVANDCRVDEIIVLKELCIKTQNYEFAAVLRNIEKKFLEYKKHIPVKFLLLEFDSYDFERYGRMTLAEKLEKLMR